MSRPSRMRRTAKSLAPYVLAAMGALSAWVLSAYSLEVVIPWRRPVQDWMTALGVGPKVVLYYAFLNLHIPDVILSCIGGGIVGTLSGSRWRSRVMVYSLAYCSAPYVITIIWYSNVLWG